MSFKASFPLPLLYPSASDFQFPSAGDRWFRACGQNLQKFSYLLLLSEIPFRIIAVEIEGSQAWGTVAE